MENQGPEHYRVSEVLDHPSKLAVMFEHFENIPRACAIVETPNQLHSKGKGMPIRTGYALWTLGKEHKCYDPASNHRLPYNPERITGKIVKECHFFRVHLGIIQDIGDLTVANYAPLTEEYKIGLKHITYVEDC